MGTDGNIQAVILLLQVLHPDILAHSDAGMYLDPQRQDGCDLGIQQVPGETVAGDAVAEHPAQLLGLLKNGDLVAHEGQIVGAAEAAGAAAHNGNGLTRGRGARRLGHIPGMIHGIALEPADIDGIVDHISAAASLAGMLAYIGAGNGEGVILADQAHGVSAAILTYQGHVAGNIHPGGAQGHTRNGVLQPCQAALVKDVLLIIIPEALQPVHHQACRVPADGAICRVDNGSSCLLNGNQGAHGGCAGKNLLQEQSQLPQADAAGHTLAAALGMAEPQEAQRHIYRA